MRYAQKDLKKIEYNQKRWDKFNNTIVYEFNKNKEEHKGQKLQNGMTITGIGKKCLKIENNFYTWEDIENVASGLEETDDIIMKNILAYIFEDYTIENNDNYKARKFTRTEATTNFEKVKEEIIEHKEYYKTGNINGIGNTAISVNGYANEKLYCNWDKILEALQESTIQDYKLTHRDDTCISYVDPIHIIDELFVDDEEETTVEKRLHEKDEEYADEKAYIYRHIISEDLTVENIRKITYNKYATEGTEKCEKIINELLQFAFKYLDKVKFTNQDYDIEESNKYAIKTKDSYFYTIENKEIIINEETAKFKDYDEVTFKIQEYNIEVYRNNEKVHGQAVGRKDMYIRVGGHAYTLSCEQQIRIIQKLGNVTIVDEAEIKRDFIDTCSNEYSILGSNILDVLQDEPETAYEKYLSVRQLAKKLYKEGRVHQGVFYRCLDAVIAEQKGIDPTLIVDFFVWDDSNFNKPVIFEDKYAFGNRDVKTVVIGFSEYEYSQNCEYTHVTQTSSGVDSFSVAEVYLEGDIPQDKAIDYFNYAEGMWHMEDELKYMLIYEGYYEKMNNHYTVKM